MKFRQADASMSSLIMLLRAGVAWPVSNSERRGGLLLVTSGIQGEAVFASGPTPVADIANVFIRRSGTTPPLCLPCRPLA
jgi:hypothetical protein